ncbi:MAG: hypothetical protein AAFY38_15455 [Pseudomonadota bacterium]
MLDHAGHMPRISLEITDETLAALRRVAQDEGWDPGAVIRDAIARDLFRRARKAKKAPRPDERSIAPLRALLADDFAYAKNWADLQSRLNGKGYALCEAGAGLALVTRDTNTRCAKASDLGYSYSRLMARFDAPFPGHAHAYLFNGR